MKEGLSKNILSFVDNFCSNEWYRYVSFLYFIFSSHKFVIQKKMFFKIEKPLMIQKILNPINNCQYKSSSKSSTLSITPQKGKLSKNRVTTHNQPQGSLSEFLNNRRAS